MSKQVIMITQKPKILSRAKLLRVAAYARVSTDHEDQQNSLQAQKEYFKKLITSNVEWEFQGLYFDEGISGLTTKQRDGFNDMIESALNGEIGHIITKSISRFARNTLDTIETIRMLKEKGISVYFQKEKINTLESDSEFILTLMSSFAHEESRSISENVTWGKRKLFADGKVCVPYSSFMGYDKGENGNKKQAKVVEYIYSMYILGVGIYKLHKYLEKYNVPTCRGKKKWNHGAIKSILTNEKYKGDALLQKSFTIDYITKKKKKNEGELPQYYVKDNHEAIISKETFERVQRLLEKRVNFTGKYSSVTIFSSRIKCGCCGGYYGSKVWHSTSKYKRKIWQCNEKFKNDERCTTPHLTEEEIKEVFVKAVNSLIKRKKTIIKEGEDLIESALDTTELESKRAVLEDKITTSVENINLCISENSKKV